MAKCFVVAPIFGVAMQIPDFYPAYFIFSHRYPASQAPLEHGHCSCGWPSRWRFPHLKKGTTNPTPLVVCDFPLCFPSIICLSMRVFFSCFSLILAHAAALVHSPRDHRRQKTAGRPAARRVHFVGHYVSPLDAAPLNQVTRPFYV